MTVMGAGIFGLSIAWICLQRGARIRIVDPRGAGGGASGGVVGALAPHTPENWNDKKAFQFESLMMAAPFGPGSMPPAARLRVMGAPGGCSRSLTIAPWNWPAIAPNLPPTFGKDMPCGRFARCVNLAIGHPPARPGI